MYQGGYWNNQAAAPPQRYQLPPAPQPHPQQFQAPGYAPHYNPTLTIDPRQIPRLMGQFQGQTWHSGAGTQQGGYTQYGTNLGYPPHEYDRGGYPNQQPHYPPQTLPPPPPSNPPIIPPADSEETSEVVCFTKRGIALQSSDQPFYVRDGKDYPIVTMEDVEQARSYQKGYIRNERRTVLGIDFDIGVLRNKKDISFVQADVKEQAAISKEIAALAIDGDNSTEEIISSLPPIVSTPPTAPKQPEEKKAAPTPTFHCDDCGKGNDSCLPVFGRFFCSHCLLHRLTTQHFTSVVREKSGKDRTEKAEWPFSIIFEAWSRVRKCLGEAAYPGPCPLEPNSEICQGSEVPIYPGDPRKGHIVGKTAVCAEGGCPVHVLCKRCASNKAGCPVCGAAMTYHEEAVEDGVDSRPPE